MTSRLIAAPAWFIRATEEVPSEGREVNSHTFIGLGLMAMILVVLWLIRRSRA